SGRGSSSSCRADEAMRPCPESGLRMASLARIAIEVEGPAPARALEHQGRHRRGVDPPRRPLRRQLTATSVAPHSHPLTAPPRRSAAPSAPTARPTSGMLVASHLAASRGPMKRTLRFFSAALVLATSCLPKTSGELQYGGFTYFCASNDDLACRDDLFDAS